ncbi:hypothetical protein BGZ76_007616 [Entomortierella beljakovae]|nr:hypothetical protein BGZ76_007616 [Entomortierella beljakovae]
MPSSEQLVQGLSALSVQDAENLEELIECARYGELEEIQAVVNSSGPEKAKFLLSQQGEYGKTPLHMASANGHIDVVEYLLTIISPEAVNIQNEQGNTALHWAAINGHVNVVEALINKGKADYKIKNEVGRTAKFEALILERDDVAAWIEKNTEEEEPENGDDDDEDEDDDDEDESNDEETKDAGEGSSSKP